MDQADGKNFTWIEDLPLRQLRNLDVQNRIIAEHEARLAAQAAKWKGTGRLVESLGGMKSEFRDHRACLICQL